MGALAVSDTAERGRGHRGENGPAVGGRAEFIGWVLLRRGAPREYDGRGEL